MLLSGVKALQEKRALAPLHTCKGITAFHPPVPRSYRPTVFSLPRHVGVSGWAGRDRAVDHCGGDGRGRLGAVRSRTCCGEQKQTRGRERREGRRLKTAQRKMRSRGKNELLSRHNSRGSRLGALSGPPPRCPRWR